MDLVVYDDDEKRYVPWAVAIAAVLLVALLTAVLTFLLARQASGDEAERAVGGVSSPEPATAPTTEPPATPSGPATSGPAPSGSAPSAAPPVAAPTTEAPAAEPTSAPACASALLLADRAVERSVAVDDALAQHTAIMDELLAERIDAQQALDQTLPVLTDGATERRRFQEAVADYRDAREQCPA